MGTDFTAVFDHGLSRNELRRLPDVLNRVWATPAAQAAVADLRQARGKPAEPKPGTWSSDDVVLPEGDDAILGRELDGPDCRLIRIHHHWLEYWDGTRYRLGFMPFAELSGPQRQLCRALARGFGADVVLYLPDWAIDNVAPNETYTQWYTHQIWTLLGNGTRPLLDLTRVPDETILEDFARERTDDEWPYFVDYVTGSSGTG